MVGVFFGIYGLILWDRFHKPSAAVLGATLMVGIGVLSQTDLVAAINWMALGVLLGTFIIASSLSRGRLLRIVSTWLPQD